MLEKSSSKSSGNHTGDWPALVQYLGHGKCRYRTQTLHRSHHPPFRSFCQRTTFLIIKHAIIIVSPEQWQEEKTDYFHIDVDEGELE